MHKKVPNHLGIILDGNRRWAKDRGLNPFFGHEKGVKTSKRIVEYARNKGIKILTLFVFSTENWKRPKKEVNFLMSLLKRALLDYRSSADKKNIRIRIIGQRERIPAPLLREIEKTEEATKKNNGMILNFALSYGGRAEIIQAVQNIVKKKIPPSKINEDIIRQNLSTSDVDLIIRTGKEHRISNFLIWQAAYSELYFSQKYWPDFSKEDLDEALDYYAGRKRRFGR